MEEESCGEEEVVEAGCWDHCEIDGVSKEKTGDEKVMGTVKLCRVLEEETCTRTLQVLWSTETFSPATLRKPSEVGIVEKCHDKEDSDRRMPLWSFPSQMRWLTSQPLEDELWKMSYCIWANKSRIQWVGVPVHPPVAWLILCTARWLVLVFVAFCDW